MTHAKSLNDGLRQLDLGERIFVEVSGKDALAPLQRRVSSTSRWPAGMAGWKLKTTSVVGIAADLTTLHYLVCIERTS